MACLLTSGYIEAADSPQWRGPRRDGVSKETAWRDDWSKKPAKVVWKASLGTGFSSFSVDDGRLYTMGYKDKDGEGHDFVYCFDAKTGEKIWEHDYPCKLVDNLHEGGPAATPTVHGDMVLTLSKEGHLICFAKKTGKIRWQVDIRKPLRSRMPEWGFSSSPLIYKGLAIVDGGPLAAFDLKSGKLSWKTESYQAGYGSAMLLTPRRGKPLIANLNNDGVILADPKDGTVSDFAQWKTSFRTNSTTPLIAGESVFISTGYKRGCALFKVSGGKLEKAYENKAIQNHMDTCVLVDGFLYGIDGNSNRPRRLLNLVCMNLKTGEVAWRQSGFGCGTVIAAGDRLIILSDRGTLAAVRANPKKFEELGRQDVLRGRCWTPPVLANGRIYCRDARGDMVCVDVSK